MERDSEEQYGKVGECFSEWVIPELVYGMEEEEAEDEPGDEVEEDDDEFGKEEKESVYFEWYV